MALFSAVSGIQAGFIRKQTFCSCGLLVVFVLRSLAGSLTWPGRLSVKMLWGLDGRRIPRFAMQQL
jgi:hypothetical protein